MKASSLLLLAVPVIGLGLFFASRGAAAKDAAVAAFEVNYNCTTIKVKDESAAKAAAIAAALSVGLDPSGNAIEKLREIGRVVLPSCPWGSAAEDEIAFEVPGRGRYTWPQVKDYVGNQTTVAEFRKFIGEAFVEPVSAEFLLDALKGRA